MDYFDSLRYFLFVSVVKDQPRKAILRFIRA